MFALTPFPSHPALGRLAAGTLTVGLCAALAAASILPGSDGAAAGLALGLVALIGLIAARGLGAAHPHPALGPANAVTLTRAGAVALLAAALPQADLLAARPGIAWVLTGLTALVLASDGLDGWLARRTGLSSAFGARFDMEVDAALGAVLCLLAIGMGKVGLWVLPLGFLRYGWLAAGARLPWLAAPLPPRFGRKTVCVVQIAALIALIAPAVTPPLSTAIAAGALAALAWSFGRDGWWLWRHRAGAVAADLRRS